jgi:hypothetical protein
MTAPTEQEIREAIDKAEVALRLDNAVGDAIYEAQQLLTDLWATDDLRPSEQKALDEAIEPIYARGTAHLAPFIVEELVAAGRRFAAEHPDAPRAKIQPGEAA